MIGGKPHLIRQRSEADWQFADNTFYRHAGGSASPDLSAVAEDDANQSPKALK
jgi:hypothetical protein